MAVISCVRELQNVSCPRVRTFVSSGVHPKRDGVANRIDYGLLVLFSLARQLHGPPVAKASG